MVNKIIKAYSLNNGNVKKTLTFSTEENSVTNETQALPHSQSSTFYGPNAPVMYSWWTDMKDWVKGAAKDTGKWIEGAAKDVKDGLKI